jgi:hypothetical protein
MYTSINHFIGADPPYTASELMQNRHLTYLDISRSYES